MKQISIFSFIFFLFLNSCSKYQEDFSKINVIGFNLLNATQKQQVEVEIDQNGKKKTLKAKVKYRGGSSIGYAKKNLSLDLTENFKFQGLNEDKNWVLGASVVDKTFLRNVFCYHFFKEWNATNKAAATKYSDVYADNEYYGFYVLTEKLDASSLELDVKTGLIFKEPYLFRNPDYILDSTALATGNYYHQKFPKNNTQHQVIDSLKDFILYSSDLFFDEMVFEYFDKQNLLDWYIMLVLSNNSDGLKKNFILYRKDNMSKFKIALWDCDHSLGRDGDYEYNMFARTVAPDRNTLFKRLRCSQSLNFENEVKKRWKELRSTKKIDLNSFYSFIDLEAKKIKPFVDRNFEKWPLGAWPYKDENDFEAELAIVKQYLKLSIVHFDKKYNYKPI